MKPKDVLPFKNYGSAAAERAAADADAVAARKRWLALAGEVEEGRFPDLPAERLMIVEALREQAARVKLPGIGRGNPKMIENRIFDRAWLAVQVEVVMRRDGKSQLEAAGIVAAEYGREDSDAVRKCHAELRDQTKLYVDTFSNLLLQGSKSKK